MSKHNDDPRIQRASWDSENCCHAFRSTSVLMFGESHVSGLTCQVLCYVPNVFVHVPCLCLCFSACSCYVCCLPASIHVYLSRDTVPSHSAVSSLTDKSACRRQRLYLCFPVCFLSLHYLSSLSKLLPVTSKKFRCIRHVRHTQTLKITSSPWKNLGKKIKHFPLQ